MQVHWTEQRPASAPHLRLQLWRQDRRRWRWGGKIKGGSGREASWRRGRGGFWRGVWRGWGWRQGGRAGQRLWWAWRGECRDEERELREAGVWQGTMLHTATSSGVSVWNGWFYNVWCVCVCVFPGGGCSVHQCGELQWSRWTPRSRPLPGTQWVMWWEHCSFSPSCYHVYQMLAYKAETHSPEAVLLPTVSCVQWCSWAARNTRQRTALTPSWRNTAGVTMPPLTAREPSSSLTSRGSISERHSTGE